MWRGLSHTPVISIIKYTLGLKKHLVETRSLNIILFFQGDLASVKKDYYFLAFAHFQIMGKSSTFFASKEVRDV